MADFGDLLTAKALTGLQVFGRLRVAVDLWKQAHRTTRQPETVEVLDWLIETARCKLGVDRDDGVVDAEFEDVSRKKP